MRIVPLLYKHRRLRHFAIVYSEHLFWIPENHRHETLGTWVDENAKIRAHKAVRKLCNEAVMQEINIREYERKPLRTFLFGPLLATMSRRCALAKEAKTRFEEGVYLLRGQLDPSGVDTVVAEASWIRSKFW